jgi:hypothetical protein
MIPIEREPEATPPYEQCCFCWNRTPFWTTLADRKGGAQVACCQECAKTHEPKEVPTKDAWFDEARARNPRFYEVREPRSPWAFQGRPAPVSASASPASSSSTAETGKASSGRRPRGR